MNPNVIVEALGVPVLARHVNTKIVWATFVRPGEATQPSVTAVSIPSPLAASGTVGPATRKALEVVDEDVDVTNVLVELEAFESETPPPAQTKTIEPVEKKDKPASGKQPARPS
jgi:hypothetical protein